MSLINDALKNAHKKADQPRLSPVNGLTLRPPEPGQPARRTVWLIPALVGLSFALVAIVAVIFYLSRTSNNTGASAENLAVNAREIAPVSSPAESGPGNPGLAAPVKEPSAVTPKNSGPQVTLSAQTVVAVNAAPPVAAALPPSTTLPPAAPTAAPTTAPTAGDPTPTPSAIVAPATPPQPEPLRLQAIVFHPTRPSALISGKSLFVGERVQGMKVVNITKDTATVSGNGKNLVLTLPE